ncbi:MAG TPA: ferrochelatase, partial [Candidatus Poseidoniales archaeon]
MEDTGVLLMNIGTPDEPTVESVRKYLREFLLDPDVIDIPAPLRHLLVRGIILRTRPQKIAPNYQSIWMEEGSPLRVYTDRMAAALQEKLGMQCEVGMRYGNPSILEGLQNLKKSGVDRVLL